MIKGENAFFRSQKPDACGCGSPLTCLPPPRLAVIRGKGTGEDEKRKELVLKSGDPAETGSRIVSSQV
jgi:hypothetical protein